MVVVHVSAAGEVQRLYVWGSAALLLRAWVDEMVIVGSVPRFTCGTTARDVRVGFGIWNLECVSYGGCGVGRGLFSDMVGNERGCKECQGYKTRREKPGARHLHWSKSFDTSISVPPVANFPVMRYVWYRTCLVLVL
mgnify:CR=1 FL=1